MLNLGFTFSLLFFLSINFSFSQSYQFDKELDSEIIVIEYKKKVEGYKFKVVWSPTEYCPLEKSIHGPSLIYIENEKGEKFVISLENYAEMTSNIKDYVEINEENYEFKFSNNNISINYASLISFEDIDFDGEKELLFMVPCLGQRSGPDYFIYKKSYDKFEYLTYEPYLSYDWTTEINTEKKEIYIYGSGGWCGSKYDTYKFENGFFKLIKTYAYFSDEETMECFEYYYEYDLNSMPILIRKKKVE